MSKKKHTPVPKPTPHQEAVIRLQALSEDEKNHLLEAALYLADAWAGLEGYQHGARCGCKGCRRASEILRRAGLTIAFAGSNVRFGMGASAHRGH